ncbi:hypothetical protein AOQ84DRAFT_124757 [Glonium stellatum]|uniref:F-box domain-containing protein n=1 Tax=Glonium stellatum TaxID=574774 RepID=A0A8E2F9P0_9PEZI|nr:hypothetical protein AOQ84DRAFT_124757 [Glonium stellatum]
MCDNSAINAAVNTSTNHTEVDLPSRRSDVLRSVFTSHPRNSRLDRMTLQSARRRISHAEQRRRATFAIRRERPRMSFHKVLSSFFNSGSSGTSTDQVHTRTNSSASDFNAQLKPPYQDSLQSIELVSPEAFIFSGPSLSLEAGSINRCTNSVSLSEASGSIGEDGILEPFLYCDITRSIPDVLHGISTPIEEVDDQLSDAASGSGYLMPNSPPVSIKPPVPFSPTPLLPSHVMGTLCSYLDFTSYKAMRLTCRSWHSALASVIPIKFPASYSLPNEIIQHIYDHLGPKDFNSSRRTCRAWMIASLDRSLLISMLKRGGWWTSTEFDLRNRKRAKQNEILIHGSEEWFLSKRLARECALAANWTGNGLKSTAPIDEHNQAPWVEAARIDFADLASGYAGPEGRHSGGLVFTVSVCGRFLLVAEGGMIYIYELEGNNLHALTSVVCPRRVLAMSMDASSSRFAVAALLDGRMGLVCDLRLGRDSNGEFSATSSSINLDNGRVQRKNSNASLFTGRTYHSGGRISTEEQNVPMMSSQIAKQNNDEHNPMLFNTIDVQAGAEGIQLQDTSNSSSYGRNYINRAWSITLRGRHFAPTTTTNRAAFAYNNSQSIPVETGPRSIYRHLCSDDDPPRSVSICPQRRCVAFGCSAGIELHWVDALTGQDLNRWFPLTAPSDFLYFLPPRPGVDSAKKLRLISSAAHPSDRPSICRRFFSSRPALSLFWGSFGFENRGPSHGSGVANCDHYRATPLSDGYHVLFTDPASSKLFLGSDAPLGGPTKLLRKILLVPPEPDDVPRIYATAADLSWGARVVVAFGDTVVLYSVPPDVFLLSKLEQKAESPEIFASTAFGSEAQTRDWWLNWWQKQDLPLQPYLPDKNPIWPLGVRGTVIGTVNGLIELAIYTSPELTIWAFALDGRAVTWQVDSGQRPLVTAERNVGRDGRVNDQYEVDMEGDIVMADMETDGERSVGFDGHDSTLLPKIPGELRVDNDDYVDSVNISSGEAWYDENGDIVMFDAEDGRPVSWIGEDTMVMHTDKTGSEDLD